MAYTEFGPVPYDEQAAQSGTDGYTPRARQECQRLIELLREKFGPEPEGVTLQIGSNPHDFGTYYDVRAVYADGDERGHAYGLAIDANVPATWDDAKKVDWREWARTHGFEMEPPTREREAERNL